MENRNETNVDSKFPMKFEYDVMKDKPVFTIVPCQGESGEFVQYLVLRLFDKEQELVREGETKEGKPILKLNYGIEPKNEVILSKINDHSGYGRDYRGSPALRDIGEMYEQISIEISRIIDDPEMSVNDKRISISRNISRIAKGEYVTKPEGNEFIKFNPTLDGRQFDNQRDAGDILDGKTYFENGEKKIEKHKVMPRKVEFDKYCYRRELRTGEWVVDEFKRTKNLSEDLGQYVVPEGERPIISDNIGNSRNIENREKDIS